MYLIKDGKEVGYWRKANQIHNWFVNNVQNGEDDCGSYEAPYEKLLELKKTCEEVLKTNNTDLLKPVEGFFFGSTEIDEYYFDNLRETIRIIDSLDKNSTYTYSSSW